MGRREIVCSPVGGRIRPIVHTPQDDLPVGQLFSHYLAARQPAQAASEFQRIVDHPHITLVDPLSALARLQLARALVLAGDPVKGKKAYEDLFTLWKDADADVPVIKQARAEFAKLSRH